MEVPSGGSVAVPAQGLSNGDHIIIDEHAYEIETTSLTPIGTVDFYTDVQGPYSTCENAVAAAVAINGTTSGCRYTFKPCCDVVGSVSYVAPFSTQGVSFSAGHIISNGYGLIDTISEPDICVTSFDYDNTVTIDNTQVSDYNSEINDNNACDDNRCSRCVASVEPCDDAGVVITWIYNPQAGYNYNVGSVFSGSNINGYTTTTSYNVGISCVKIVTTATATEGIMTTVSDGSGQDNGTHISMQTAACGCNSGVRVRNSFADGGAMGGGTSVTYTWNLCGGSTLQTHVLAAGNGVSTLYDIPGCIDMDSLSWTPTGSNSGISLPGDCCNGST